MHVILGATGHVGSTVADELLRRSERITVVTRDPRRAEPYVARGAEAAVLDIGDVAALGAIFRRARSASSSCLRRIRRRTRSPRSAGWSGTSCGRSKGRPSTCRRPVDVRRAAGRRDR